MSYGSDHTHYGYADAGHGHSGYAADSHTHQGYELYDVASEHHEHMLSQVAGAAAADHDHYIDTTHDHDGEYIPRAAVADMLEAFRLEYRGEIADFEAEIRGHLKDIDQAVNGLAGTVTRTLALVGRLAWAVTTDDGEHQADELGRLDAMAADWVAAQHGDEPEAPDAP